MTATRIVLDDDTAEPSRLKLWRQLLDNGHLTVVTQVDPARAPDIETAIGLFADVTVSVGRRFWADTDPAERNRLTAEHMDFVRTQMARLRTSPATLLWSGRGVRAAALAGAIGLGWADPELLTLSLSDAPMLVSAAMASTPSRLIGGPLARLALKVALRRRRA